MAFVFAVRIVPNERRADFLKQSHNHKFFRVLQKKSVVLHFFLLQYRLQYLTNGVFMRVYGQKYCSTAGTANFYNSIRKKNKREKIFFCLIFSLKKFSL